MATVITINQTDADHLANVISEMRVRGAPTIRCIRDDTQGVILALEGSHRLAAAKALDIEPNFVFLADDDTLTCADIGFDDMCWFGGEPARAADIRDRIASPMGTYSGTGEWLEFDVASYA